MAKKTTFSPEQMKAVSDLVKTGLQGTQIVRKLKEDGIFSDDVKYPTVAYHIKKMRRTSKQGIERHEAEIEVINSLTTLTEEMTSWLRQLRTEYNTAEDFISIGEDKWGKPVAIQPKRDIRNSIDRNIGHYVTLLKSSTVTNNTQVNVLQQQLHQDLMRVINERPKPIPVNINTELRTAQ